MIEEAWRRIGGVVAHEGGVSCSQPRAWLARWLLAAGSAAMVLVFALSHETPSRPNELEDSMRGASGALGLAVYFALLFLFPWMLRGAVERGGRRGRIDLLAASPLTDVQVFTALLGGRLLAAMHILLGLAPAVMTLAWLGGGAAIAHLIQVLGISLLVAWLATSYACFNALLGVTEGAVWTRLIIFITATPLAIPHGFRACLIALPVFALLTILVGLEPAGKIISLVFCASFPFWTLGVSIVDGTLFGSHQAAALGACLVLGPALSFEVARRFPRWLREREEVVEREVSSYSRRRRPRARQASRFSTEDLLGSYRRRRLSNMSRWVRLLYRLSRRSAYVVRELLRDDFRGEALGASLFVLFVLAWWSDLTFRADRGGSPGSTAATFALVPCTFLAVFEASRAVPSRGTSALAVFLSSPLTGWQIFAGSLLAGWLRLRYAFIAVLGMGLTVREGLDFLRASAFVLLFASFCALAHGIGLWSALLAPSQAVSAALALGTCIALGPGTAWFWPTGAPPHPLAAWYSTQPAAIFLTAGMVAAAALVLGIAFALVFRRLAARWG